jgi:hypothetical protein
MGKRYSFEVYRSLNKITANPQAAKDDADAFMERLRPAPALDKEKAADNELLQEIQDFCSEVTLNIAWYEKKRRELQWLWCGLFALIFILTCGGGILTAALATTPDSSLWLTFALGLTLPTLQAFASAIDYKARLGAFWKASADLKELLFSIEDDWHNKDLSQPQDFVSASGITAPKTFKQALKEGRIRARQICRQERDEFFQTYLSPSQLVEKLSLNFSDLRTRNTEFLKAQKEFNSVANLKAASENITKFIDSMPDPAAKKEAIAASVKVLRGTLEELEKSAS